MKTTKIIFWISTTLIFLFEGVMPAFTGNSELAIEGIRHLGYPDYFRIELNILKITGTLALMIPFTPATLKEWAYAGFTFTTLSACIAHLVVDGFHALSFFPLIILAVLMVSYVSYRKIQRAKKMA